MAKITITEALSLSLSKKLGRIFLSHTGSPFFMDKLLSFMGG